MHNLTPDYLRLYPGTFFKHDDVEYGHKEAAITISAPDGTRLSGWFYNRGEGTPLVAMYCGNCMNAGDFNFIAHTDKTRSYLLINYRGYGSSEGSPNETNIVADARHCLQVARSLLNNRPGPLYLVGYSLGSAVAIQVAVEENPARLVLITPFDCYATVIGQEILDETPGIADWISTAFAPRITCPVTVMRAEYDTVVPPTSTAALVRAFHAPLLEKCYPGEHGTILFEEGCLPDLMEQLSP